MGASSSTEAEPPPPLSHHHGGAETAEALARFEARLAALEVKIDLVAESARGTSAPAEREPRKASVPTSRSSAPDETPDEPTTLPRIRGQSSKLKGSSRRRPAPPEKSPQRTPRRARGQPPGRGRRRAPLPEPEDDESDGSAGADDPIAAAERALAAFGEAEAQQEEKKRRRRRGRGGGRGGRGRGTSRGGRGRGRGGRKRRGGGGRRDAEQRYNRAVDDMGALRPYVHEAEETTDLDQQLRAMSHWMAPDADAAPTPRAQQPPPEEPEDDRFSIGASPRMAGGGEWGVQYPAGRGAAGAPQQPYRHAQEVTDAPAAGGWVAESPAWGRAAGGAAEGPMGLESSPRLPPPHPPPSGTHAPFPHPRSGLNRNVV